MRYLLLLLLFVSEFAAAQTVEGHVVDAKTNEPLAFVNVGVVGRAVGTVTDEAGYFKLTISSEYKQDSLRLSIIGYQARSYSVYDLLYDKPITQFKLTKASHELAEVEVTSKKLRPKVLGSTTTSPYFTGGFTTDDLGNEVGVRINVGRKPVYLQEFNFHIASNSCDSLLFRVNVYSIKEDLPDSILLRENVLVGTTITSGTVTVDMKPYNLYIEDDFIITIEYIKPCSERSLAFSAGFIGAIYARTTSQADWEKVKGFNLGFNVKVLR